MGQGRRDDRVGSRIHRGRSPYAWVGSVTLCLGSVLYVMPSLGPWVSPTRILLLSISVLAITLEIHRATEGRRDEPAPGGERRPPARGPLGPAPGAPSAHVGAVRRAVAALDGRGRDRLQAAARLVAVVVPAVLAVALGQLAVDSWADASAPRRALMSAAVVALVLTTWIELRRARGRRG